MIDISSNCHLGLAPYKNIKNYELNYTAKQLGVIYEYYNIGNPNKLKKIEIAQIIVAFEHDKDNMEVVERRKTLWFYMTELKSDPFTKKYVWSPWNNINTIFYYYPLNVL